MQKINLSLEEDHPNFREQEIPFKLTVENTGAEPIELMTLSVRIPEKAELLQTRDFSSLAFKAQHAQLCGELSVLTKDVLATSDAGLRGKVIALQKEILESVARDIGFNFFSLYLRIANGTFLRLMADQKRREGALFIRIESAADADYVRQSLLPALQVDPAIVITYTLKSDKLRALEVKLGTNNMAMTAIAQLEPDSVFAATYIVRFPRNLINPSQYGFAIEASYREVGKPELHNAVASRTICISPMPSVLTVIAVSSSILGVVLKRAIALATMPDTRFAYESLFIANDLIASGILALVLVNVFEFTDLLKEVRQRLGWRTALLTGVLCGVASERIIAAIKAMIGA